MTINPNNGVPRDMPETQSTTVGFLEAGEPVASWCVPGPRTARIEVREFDRDGNLLKDGAWEKDVTDFEAVCDEREKLKMDVYFLRQQVADQENTIQGLRVQVATLSEELGKALESAQLAGKQREEACDMWHALANKIADREVRLAESEAARKKAEAGFRKVQGDAALIAALLDAYTPPKLVIFGKRIF